MRVFVSEFLCASVRNITTCAFVCVYARACEFMCEPHVLFAQASVLHSEIKKMCGPPDH